MNIKCNKHTQKLNYVEPDNIKVLQKLPGTLST